MKYIDYAIKYIIRRIIRFIFKPIVLCFLFIAFILFFVIVTDTQAVYLGDDTYTDPNNTILLAYDSVISDFVTRLSSTSSSTDLIVGLLKNPNYNYYVYYGNTDGSSMINGSTWKTTQMHILFFETSVTPSFSTENNYQGIRCSIYESSDYAYYFVFNSSTLQNMTSFDININCQFPAILLPYKSSVLTNFLTDNSTKNSNDVVSAIEDTAQKTQDTIKDSTEQVTGTLTDSTVSDSSMTVDTSQYDVDDSEGVTNFITSFLDIVKKAFFYIDSSVETITIPIPNTEQTVVLYSDIISKHITGTYIYTLIQSFWWFVIGGYIIIFAKRMIEWLSTGEIAEKGVFGFIWWLDVHNEIIKSYMM